MNDVWHVLRGALMTKALAAVVHAKVQEALADGPRPVVELPGESDTLHRLLRALASDGVFRETEAGVFEHTDRSRLLLEPGWSEFAHLFGGVLLGRSPTSTLRPSSLRSRAASASASGVARRAFRRASSLRRGDGGRARDIGRASGGTRLARGRHDPARRAESRAAAGQRIRHQAGRRPARREGLDLLMLVLAGGRQRSEEQWRALLEAGGFKVESLENPIVATCR